MEDWFQVAYGAELVDRHAWSSLESHIEPMVDTLLQLFDDKGVHGTFFVVGWLGEAHPGLIRRIHDQGHEIASHSYWHREVFRLEPAEFREDVNRAKAALEQAIGAVVPGFRAPGYSIRPSEDWALDILVEAGHRYDSSLLHAAEPVYEVRPGLIEIAPNALRLGQRYFPVNGGFYFRALPYAVYRRYVKRLNRHGQRLVYYNHTWEPYTTYPRMPLPGLQRFIQYFNLHSVRGKLARLLDDFEFTSIERTYPQMGFAQHPTGTKLPTVDKDFA